MLHAHKFDLKRIRAEFDALPQDEKDRIYAENKERTARMLESWRKFEQEHPELARTMKCAA
jgi:hypothetical protein